MVDKKRASNYVEPRILWAVFSRQSHVQSYQQQGYDYLVIYWYFACRVLVCFVNHVIMFLALANELMQSVRDVLKGFTYIWINNLKFHTVYFIVCPSRGLPKHIETKVANHLLLLHIKLFLKKHERRSGTIFTVLFSA